MRGEPKRAQHRRCRGNDLGTGETDTVARAVVRRPVGTCVAGRGVARGAAHAPSPEDRSQPCRSCKRWRTRPSGRPPLRLTFAQAGRTVSWWGGRTQQLRAWRPDNAGSCRGSERGGGTGSEAAAPVNRSARIFPIWRVERRESREGGGPTLQSRKKKHLWSPTR